MAASKSATVAQLLNSATKKAIPVNALFELTYRCNLKCRHCYVVDHDSGELTTAEVKRVLDEMADAGTLFLTFSGGEALLRRDIFEIGEYAVKKGFALRLFTNGTTIDAETVARLKSLNLIDVGISVYGATASSHEFITDAPGSFARAMKALEILHEAGTQTIVKYMIMKHNVNEFSEARKLAENLGATFAFSYSVGPRLDGALSPCEYRVDADDLRVILADGFLYENSVRIKESERVDCRGEGLAEAPTCGAARDQCTITPYGDVVPCTGLRLSAGNLRDKAFMELWSNSESFNKLRKIFMSDVKACRDCVSVGYCGRCPGFALLEDGDLLGPSSFACLTEEVGRKL